MVARPKNGRDCVLVSGILLIGCGVIAMISSFSAQSIVDTAMDEACILIIADETCLSEAGTSACNDNCTAQLGSTQVGTTAYDVCFADCKVARAADYSISMQDCQSELRSQSGCSCEADGNGGWRCDCEGQLVGIIQEYWKAACYILGTLAFLNGVLCTGLPAVYIALRGSRGWCCRITCYSTCAALWCAPFLGIGAVFVMVAFLHQWQGNISETLGDCEADVSDSASGGALTVNFESGSNCGLPAFCDALQSVSRDVMAPALAVGIPFTIGGLVMLVGSYACCCCSTSLPNPNQVSASKMEEGAGPKSARSRGSRRDVAADDGAAAEGEAAQIDVTKVDKASFIAAQMGEVGPQKSFRSARRGNATERGSRRDLGSARGSRRGDVGEGYGAGAAKEGVEGPAEGEEEKPQLDRWEQELKSAREEEAELKTARSDALAEPAARHPPDAKPLPEQGLQSLSARDAKLQRKESRRLARAASRGAPQGASSRSGHDWRAALENLAQEREAEQEEEAATVIQRELRAAKERKETEENEGGGADRSGKAGESANPEPVQHEQGGKDADGGRGGFGPLGLNARDEVGSEEGSPR